MSATELLRPPLPLRLHYLIIPVTNRKTGDPATGQLDRGVIFAAARMQTGHALDGLARKLMPAYTWDDLVLPEDAVAQLREICARVSLGHLVLDGWAFE